MALFSIGLFFSAARSSFINAQFDSSNAGRTSAIIDRMQFYPGHGGSYRLTFHFMDDRNMYHSTEGLVRAFVGSHLQVGSSIPIKFMKYDPLEYRIDLPGDDAAEMPIFFALLGGIFALIGGWSFWRVARTP